MRVQQHQPKPSQPPLHSSWREMIIDTMRAEYPRRPSREQREQFIAELAKRLAALQGWEGYDKNHLPCVALKRGYREVAKLEGHRAGVGSLHALSDGRIVSGAWWGDEIIRIWSPDRDGVWCSVSPNRDTSWVGVVTGLFARLWNLAVTGVGPGPELKGHTRCVLAVQGLPDGRIVSGAQDKTVRFWSPNYLRGWDTKSTILFSSEVCALQVLPDGSVLTGHRNGDLIHSRPTNDGGWEQERLLEKVGSDRFQLLPDNRLVSAGGDGAVRVFTRAESHEWREQTITVSESALTALQVMPNGRIIVGGADGCVRVLEPNGKGDFLSTEVGRHQREVHCVYGLPDGRIVSGGTDKKIRIWTLGASGNWREEVLEGHEDWVNCLLVLPNGLIVSGSSDKTIRIWDGDPVHGGVW